MGCGSSTEAAEPASVEGNNKPEEQPENESKQETAGRDSKTSEDGENVCDFFFFFKNCTCCRSYNHIITLTLVLHNNPSVF